MALAVTQPYIAKARIELIDSNTDPNFNQILSAQAFLAQAQQALLKLQNRGADGLAQSNNATGHAKYLRPKYIGNETDPSVAAASIAAYRAAIDAAIGTAGNITLGITGAIAQLSTVIADANS